MTQATDNAIIQINKLKTQRGKFAPDVKSLDNKGLEDALRCSAEKITEEESWIEALTAEIELRKISKLLEDK